MKHFITGFLLVTVACNRPAPEPSASDQPRGVVDSILPTEEEIRRFKAQVGGPFPTELEDAAPARDELVQRFIYALETADTTAAQKLAVNAREYIELYYPHSQYTRAPYKQSPALLWFLMTRNSKKGVSRAFARYGGSPTGFRGLECKPDPIMQERNRLWSCVVRWAPAAGKPDPMKLFGSILERDGRFKFLSYANDL